MTEEQLRATKEFGDLPIYDADDDAGCNQLDPTRSGDTSYEGAMPEAEDESHFWDMVHDKRYELRGAFRYSADDVRAIFWLKRDDETE